MNAIAYASRLFYEPSRIHAAAVYCSDGRMGDHFDDFLQNGLRLPRYDRVALPGGPAMLLDHGCSRSHSAATRDALSFLVEAHGAKWPDNSHGSDPFQSAEAWCPLVMHGVAPAPIVSTVTRDGEARGDHGGFTSDKRGGSLAA